jgi:hypothetical protein
MKIRNSLHLHLLSTIYRRCSKLLARLEDNDAVGVPCVEQIKTKMTRTIRRGVVILYSYHLQICLTCVRRRGVMGDSNAQNTFAVTNGLILRNGLISAMSEDVVGLSRGVTTSKPTEEPT